MRVTKKDLETLLERLNEVSNKKYLLQRSYGSWSLHVSLNGKDTRDGIKRISFEATTSEMYMILNALLEYALAEQNPNIPNQQ